MAENKDFSDLFHYFVEGVLLGIVGCFGVLANIVAIIFFSRKKSHQAFYRLMAFLALFDLLYLMSSILLFSAPLLYPSLAAIHTFARIVPYILPTAHVGMTGSIYLTISLAMERYITVCHPFWKISHNWPARYYILPISVFALVYNLPKFFELEAIDHYIESYPDYNGTLYDDYYDNETDYFEPQLIILIQPTRLRVNRVYIIGYIVWANFIANCVLPFLVLLYLNVAIYRELKKLQIENTANPGGQVLRQKERKLAQVSFIIVFAFILCHSFKWIPNLWEMKQAFEEEEEKFPIAIEYITYLSHLMTTVNGTVNVIIYYLKHGRTVLGGARQRRRQEDRELGDLTSHHNRHRERSMVPHNNVTEMIPFVSPLEVVSSVNNNSNAVGNNNLANGVSYLRNNNGNLINGHTPVSPLTSLSPVGETTGILVHTTEMGNESNKVIRTIENRPRHLCKEDDIMETRFMNTDDIRSGSGDLLDPSGIALAATYYTGRRGSSKDQTAASSTTNSSVRTMITPMASSFHGEDEMEAAGGDELTGEDRQLLSVIGGESVGILVPRSASCLLPDVASLSLKRKNGGVLASAASSLKRSISNSVLPTGRHRSVSLIPQPAHDDSRRFTVAAIPLSKNGQKGPDWPKFLQVTTASETKDVGTKV